MSKTIKEIDLEIKKLKETKQLIKDGFAKEVNELGIFKVGKVYIYHNRHILKVEKIFRHTEFKYEVFFNDGSTTTTSTSGYNKGYFSDWDIRNYKTDIDETLNEIAKEVQEKQLEADKLLTRATKLKRDYEKEIANV